jgi:N-acetylglucosamine kinase-like BadF-type ATPase
MINSCVLRSWSSRQRPGIMLTEHRSAEYVTVRRLRSQNAVIGIDGGGTKTEAVIMDAAYRVLGSGISGPSNPLRVGIANAAAAVREAIDKACEAAQLRRSDIQWAEVGLAGARREGLRSRMREALSDTGIGEIEVVGDADIALYGATDGEPGLVVIAGTGSICCGINGNGKQLCAGGWGPIVGDEGSASWIARRALSAIARGTDGRGPETVLATAAIAYFHISAADDLSTAIYAPTLTNERIAGFARRVAKAGRAKDQVALEILAQAGKELGIAAAAVIRRLKMECELFQVAFVGGVFSDGGELVLSSMREQVKAIAPKAYLAPPRFSPAVAAARMAREHLSHVALAV